MTDQPVRAGYYPPDTVHPGEESMPRPLVRFATLYSAFHKIKLKRAPDASSDRPGVLLVAILGGRSRMTSRGPAANAYPQGGKLRVTVPAKQVRILWIASTPAGTRSANILPENARAPQWRHYVGDWSVSGHEADSATLKASFVFPAGGEPFLNQSVPAPTWANEPWNFDKAYLVLLLKDETGALGSNWVSDSFFPPPASHGEDPAGSLPVLVNGVAKSARPFKTIREQRQGKTPRELASTFPTKCRWLCHEATTQGYTRA